MAGKNSDVSRFLKKMALLVAVLLAVDTCFGILFDRLFVRLPVRDKIPATINQRFSATPDIVLVGSSRCHHHYDASMLLDSVNKMLDTTLTIYNFGLDAVYVYSNLCAIESMLDRYTPLVIILDANSHEFDMVYRHLVATAAPYYWRDSAAFSYINQAHWSNRLKMLSSLYRYSGATPLRMAEVLALPADSLYGFLPLDALLDTSAGIPHGPTLEEFQEDPLSAECFGRVAARCKERGVIFIVADSPRYRPLDNSDYVRLLCDKYGVPFLDFYSTDFFNRRPDLFYDPGHLNREGTRIFTTLFFDTLRCFL